MDEHKSLQTKDLEVAVRYAGVAVVWSLLAILAVGLPIWHCTNHLIEGSMGPGVTRISPPTSGKSDGEPCNRTPSRTKHDPEGVFIFGPERTA